MWTAQNRGRYDRSKLRYPSDLTDDEWAYVEPLIPPAKRGGNLDRIHHALYVACREQGEREASPTAAIVDSQSVKSAEKGGPASIRMAMTRAKRSRGRSAIFS